MSQPEIRNSIEEIAQLLLILHENYIKESNSTLSSLAIFLHDLGLLSQVSVLDIESIRQTIASRRERDDQDMMTYEDFYAFLRELGNLIFRNTGEGGRKALHLLLTEHIIPFATSRPRIQKSVGALPKFLYPSPKAFDVMLHYRDFLYLWYSSLTLKEHHRLTPTRDIWERCVLQTTMHSSRVSFARVVIALTSCAICPQVVNEIEIKRFIEEKIWAPKSETSVVKYDSINGILAAALPTAKSIDFDSFLVLLEWISQRMKLTGVQETMLGKETDAARVTILLQKISQNLLESVLLKFVVYESNKGLKFRPSKAADGHRSNNGLPVVGDRTGSSASGHYNNIILNTEDIPADVRSSLAQTASLCAASTLWLARQSGLTQLSGSDMLLMYDELSRKSDASKLIGGATATMIGGGVQEELRYSSSSSFSPARREILRVLQDSPSMTPSKFVSAVASAPRGEQRLPAWSLAHLPRTLAEISEILTKVPLSVYMHLPGVSSNGRYALYICKVAPATLFASPDRIPSLLDSLYTPEAVQLCRRLLPDLHIFFDLLASAHPAPPGESYYVSLEGRSRRTEVLKMPSAKTLDACSGFYENMVLDRQLNSSQEFQYATYRNFDKLCEITSVSPGVILSNLALKASEYVLGYALSSRGYDRKIYRGDWLEILFVVAQVAFNEDHTLGPFSSASIPSQYLPEKRATPPSSSSSKSNGGSLNLLNPAMGIADAVENMSRLLKCFIDPHNIAEYTKHRASISSTSVSLFARESLRGPLDYITSKADRLEALARAVENCEVSAAVDAVKSAPAVTPEKSRMNATLQSLASYGVPAAVAQLEPPPATLATVRGGNKSLADVLILLLHFPFNSFDFNPWLVSQYFLLKPELDLSTISDSTFAGSQRLRRQGEDWRPEEDHRPRLTAILDLISKKCKVTPEYLAQYFAMFYSLYRDYTVDPLPKGSTGEVSVSMAPAGDGESLSGVWSHEATLAGNADEEKDNNADEDNDEEPNIDFIGVHRKRQKIVMKLHIRQELASPFFDNFISERTLRLLHANCELLSWEFSRTCTKQRSVDPFTDGLITPLPTSTVVSCFPSDTKMSSQSALTWAQEVAGLSVEEALTELAATALLSGVERFELASSRRSFLLTYSSFVVFAVRCFTCRVYARPELSEAVSSELFVECIREMLSQISCRLNVIQKSLSVPILRSMFGTAVLGPRDLINLNTDDIHSAIRSAMALYERCRGVPLATALIDESRSSYMPPRPPSTLWDAPRFIEFCSFCGIIDYVESIGTVLSAFEAYLRLENGPLIRLRKDKSISPLPVQSTPKDILQLLKMTLAFCPISADRAFTQQQPSSSTGDAWSAAASSVASVDRESSHVRYVLQNVISPVLASRLDSITSATKPSTTNADSTEPQQQSLSGTLIIHSDRQKSLEDIIRYGGDRAMTSFLFFRERVRDAYRALVAIKPCRSMSKGKYWAMDAQTLDQAGSDQSPGEFTPYAHFMEFFGGGGEGEERSLRGETTGSSPTIRGLLRQTNGLPGQSDEAYDYEYEASLSSVCKYLSCCGLLRAGSVALQVKKSLHPRLRPLPQLTSNPFSGEQRGEGTSSSSNSSIHSPSHPNTHSSAGGATNAAASSTGTSSNGEAPGVVPGLSPGVNPYWGNRRPQVKAEEVPVSLAEFEEMFIRCAFLAWEVSGAIASSPNPDEMLLIYNDGTILGTVPSLTVAAVEQYCLECARSAAAREQLSRSSNETRNRDDGRSDHHQYRAAVAGISDHNNDSGEGESEVEPEQVELEIKSSSDPRDHQGVGTWGTDFFGPFARTVFALSIIIPAPLAPSFSSSEMISNNSISSESPCGRASKGLIDRLSKDRPRLSFIESLVDADRSSIRLETIQEVEETSRDRGEGDEGGEERKGEDEEGRGGGRGSDAVLVPDYSRPTQTTNTSAKKKFLFDQPVPHHPFTPHKSPVDIAKEVLKALPLSSPLKSALASESAVEAEAVALVTDIKVVERKNEICFDAIVDRIEGSSGNSSIASSPGPTALLPTENGSPSPVFDSTIAHQLVHTDESFAAGQIATPSTLTEADVIPVAVPEASSSLVELAPPEEAVTITRVQTAAPSTPLSSKQPAVSSISLPSPAILEALNLLETIRQRNNQRTVTTPDGNISSGSGAELVQKLLGVSNDDSLDGRDEEAAAALIPTAIDPSFRESIHTARSAVEISELIDGTKEALWPVYATYCSCGDSLDPGKLSGPNLFALLSKLNVLTDNTHLSDVSILLHQVAAHNLSGFSHEKEVPEAPSLTFEEFLVFLYAFAQLRFEGTLMSITDPLMGPGPPPSYTVTRLHRSNQDHQIKGYSAEYSEGVGKVHHICESVIVSEPRVVADGEDIHGSSTGGISTPSREQSKSISIDTSSGSNAGGEGESTVEIQRQNKHSLEVDVSAADNIQDTSAATTSASTRTKTYSESLATAMTPRRGAWFSSWQRPMASSHSFRRLLQEIVLPILRRYPLLTAPEDARKRDKYACIFTLDVLVAVEVAESTLKEYFDLTVRSSSSSSSSPLPQLQQPAATATSAATIIPISPHGSSYPPPVVISTGGPIEAILSVLQRMHIVPDLVQEDRIYLLLADVLPKDVTGGRHRSSSSTPTMTTTAATATTANLSNNSSTKLIAGFESIEPYSSNSSTAAALGGVSGSASGSSSSLLLFPQWEWAICVAAYVAVEASGGDRFNDQKRLQQLVAEVIDVISAVMRKEIQDARESARSAGQWQSLY